MLHSHLRAALALRCVTEGLGPEWHVAKVAYRLRKPVCAPAGLAYTARVTEVEDDSMSLELIEEHPSGGMGFEGTVRVSKTRRQKNTNGCALAPGETHDIGIRTWAASHPGRELLRVLR